MHFVQRMSAFGEIIHCPDIVACAIGTSVNIVAFCDMNVASIIIYMDIDLHRKKGIFKSEC